jgi:hypothetical protein
MTWTLPREFIIEALDNIAMDEDCLRPAYGGRGMYPNTCPGIVLPSHAEFARFCMELGHMIADNPYWHDKHNIDTDAVTKLAYADDDNMAREWIFYWRGLTLTD